MGRDPRVEDAPGHVHLVDFPEALAALFSRMSELRVVLGPDAGPGVDQVEQALREGLSARERGDVPGAVARIGQAMDRLAQLVSAHDPAEGAMLGAVVEQFRRVLARGALGEAKETADVMRARSGATLRRRKDR